MAEKFKQIPKLGGISAIEVNFMAFDLLKFSRPKGGYNSRRSIMTHLLVFSSRDPLDCRGLRAARFCGSTKSRGERLDECQGIVNVGWHDNCSV